MKELINLQHFIQLENINDRFIIDLNTNKINFSYYEIYIEIKKFENFLKSINIKKKEVVAIVLFNSIEFVISFLALNFNNYISLPLNTNLKKHEYNNYLNNCKYIIIHDYDENNINYNFLKQKHSYYKNVINDLIEISKLYKFKLIKIKKNEEEPYFSYSYISFDIDNKNENNDNINEINDNINENNDNINENMDNIDENDICLYLHTSGTTSKIKIVQHTNNNIKSTICNITKSYKLTNSDNTIIVMPLYHVHGLIGILLPTLYNKGNILFQQCHTFNARNFWKDIINYNITFFSAVPTILKILIIRYNTDYINENKDFINNLNEYNIDNKPHKLRFIRACSSILDEDLEKEIEEKFQTTVLQAYGMTEACHQVSTNIVSDNLNYLKKYKSVGIPNMDIIIYNSEKKKICDVNEIGEICINGKNLMYGYKEKKDNENIFVYVNNIEKEENIKPLKYENYFKTGDIGYIDKDNFLFLCGRIKEIINKGGEKIIPNEIDDIFKKNKIVKDCLTFSIKDEIYNENIASAIILEDSFINNISEDIDVIFNLRLYHIQKELKEYLRKYVSDYKIPKYIYFVLNFRKTDTGKLSRKLISEDIKIIREKEINNFEIIGIILKKYNIDYIFGVYGYPISKIINFFIKNEVYFISFRNEINASLCSNFVNFFDINKKKIGIICTCSGPGFINSLSGLYNAKINNYPIIIISFENFVNNNLSLFEKYNNFQFFPQYEFLKKSKEICQFSYNVDSLESFIKYFDKSVKKALKYKCPIYINISLNLLFQATTLDKSIEYLNILDENINDSHSMHLDLENINDVDKLILLFSNIYNNNKKGVILLGMNIDKKSLKYILKITEYLKLPIITTPMAKSLIKENYLYNGNQCKSYIFKNIDFCFAIGCTFNFYFKFGEYENCCKENMLCIDIKNDIYNEKQLYEKIHYFFFYDLYIILKKIYLFIKTITIDYDIRLKWIELINEIKKQNINLAKKKAIEYMLNEKCTMQFCLLTIRKYLIDYYFNLNNISDEYKNYFINYTEQDMNNITIENDCDVSDSSSDEIQDKQKKKKNKEKQIQNKNQFLTKDIKKRIIIANEGGLTLNLGIFYLPHFGFNNFIIPNKNGMMGVVLNASIAACFNNLNDNIVFCIIGDSSFGFNMNEIETICRLKLKIVIIILNNNGIYHNNLNKYLHQKNNAKYLNENNMNEKYFSDVKFYLKNPSTLYFFSKYENYIISHGGYGKYIDKKENFIKEITYITTSNFSQFPVLLNVIIQDENMNSSDLEFEHLIR